VKASEDAAAWCAQEVRRHDRERWLTALFAPEPARGHLMVLYALNLELARARETVSQPALGLMRLQWWREALDEIAAGRPRAHPVAQALRGLPLDRAVLDRLLAAREADMEDLPIADLAALEAYADGTAATLAHLALDLLGAGDTASRAAARHAGIAWAMVGLIRAVPFHAAQRRLYLPLTLLAQAGIDPEAVLAGRFDAPLARAVEQVAATAAAHLHAVRGGFARAALPALLPAVLARRHLARLRRAGCNPFRLPPTSGGPLDQLALLWRAWRGVL
jgi:NADH dehydrogenase [ubiquinone] 1 alpha subcomplex assembly factor 6